MNGTTVMIDKNEHCWQLVLWQGVGLLCDVLCDGGGAALWQEWGYLVMGVGLLENWGWGVRLPWDEMELLCTGGGAALGQVISCQHGNPGATIIKLGLAILGPINSCSTGGQPLLLNFIGQNKRITESVDSVCRDTTYTQYMLIQQNLITCAVVYSPQWVFQ